MKLRTLFLSGLLMLASASLMAQLSVTDLRCEQLRDPLGIDDPRPEFSWVLEASRPGTMQSAYELRMATDAKDVVRGRRLHWQSGRVATSQSLGVDYEGPELGSFTQLFWQVRIWDDKGKRSKWSPVASFEMGYMDDVGRKASWISAPWQEDPEADRPSPYLRKEFSPEKGVRKARLYISARGLYEAEINGQKVGNQEFTPGWTTYGKRIQYQVFDVTDMLSEGPNALGIVLGDGWFRGNLAFHKGRNIYGDELSCIAELHMSYSDGSRSILTTDGSWKASTGPIVRSDIYNGECYDARQEIQGWSSPGFDESSWQKVKIAEDPDAGLIASEGPPVRVVNQLEPLSIEKREEGWLVDMGQNMVGWIRLKASGPKGDSIVLRHAEVLDMDGRMYYTNLRRAKQTNTYVLKGEGEEVFEPTFTFQGFRYLMVQNYPGTLTRDAIRGMVVHSDMEALGTFECSDSLINQLQHNILWGLKGNFLDVPTDCPQRDERLGWTGDAQAFAPTACFNVDAAAFFRKWLKDLALDQGEDGSIPHVVPDVIGGGGATGWADAGVVIPWVLYLEYGDTTVLEDQYESMKAWIGFMQDHAGEDLIWQERDWHYGDWLAYASTSSSYQGAFTIKDLIATAYYSYSSSLVAKTAAILGKEEDAAYYSKLSENIKTAFRQEYVTPNGRLASHTQTAYTLALAFDMLDGEQAEKAARHLAGDVEQFGHITTGFLGTPLISLTLSATGRTDLAYMLLNRKDYPSWLYPVTMGATTIWERWDGIKPDGSFQDPGMNSYNHYAYGAIGKWLYQVVAGIGADESAPGYKHIIIHPRPGGGLSHARATHLSRYGEIVSGWKLQAAEQAEETEGGKGPAILEMEVVIPANTTADIHVPGDAAAVEVNGSLLADTDIPYQKKEGGLILQTGSGNYYIRTLIKP